MDVLLPVVWASSCIHVVQDQLKEDELLRDGAKRVVEAEHVVPVLGFDAGERKGKTINDTSVSVKGVKAVTHVWTPSDLR